MIYKHIYETPKNFSNIIMNSDGEFLTRLCFEHSKNTYKNIINCKEKELPIFKETTKWLNIYFSSKEPNFTPKYKIENLTPFRKEVIDIINNIKFGKTITYNEIAKIIANKRKIKKMAPQAVGGAVGWNPICIVIPCHRVIGVNGNLVGYSSGIKNKIALLEIEKNDINQFFIPKTNIIL